MSRSQIFDVLRTFANVNTAIWTLSKTLGKIKYYMLALHLVRVLTSLS